MKNLPTITLDVAVEGFPIIQVLGSFGRVSNLVAVLAG